ncbi:RidA family protein [Methylobacterium terricola]|uniref:RidA family protein n=1 Tax=Methylobacterium terricola TaxID=2583531 RepID=A0A5C4L7K3_9HYPH|nr:RidA family protein [Methylobacterium terricola]
MTIRNPAGRAAPETYHHGIEVSGPTRTLYIAGQIGTLTDGSIPPGIADQADAVFANMKLVLDEAGMTFADIVKTTVFLTDPADRAGFSAVRARYFASAKPASTLLYVAGLARPEMVVEVEAIAVAAT